MGEVYISFYLKTCRIRIFLEALRGIGCPRRVCLMISPSGRFLALSPYQKRDFKSHGVPDEVYQSGRPFEISSSRLCSALAELYSWDITHSYRVHGELVRAQRLILFDLSKVERIEK